METPQPVVNRRPFCCTLKCFVKFLRLVVTVASMIFFIVGQAPEPYIVITGFEVTIIFCFLVLYTCGLDKIMRSFFWPLLDVINSMVTALCMLIVSVLALIPETSTKTILGGVFGFLTVTCTIADCALMCQKLRFHPRHSYKEKSTDVIGDRG
ncbi:chemokine-like factor isoform X1 [Mus caroli]|uniref:Chemokine-like factor isoform X1 n=1 Tax=Mus caroli TaxID=10089 RepID=A0A6P5Q8E0_MUSCR|nr:chemokine-like factor isoform X1 [Mus caroli]